MERQQSIHDRFYESLDTIKELKNKNSELTAANLSLKDQNILLSQQLSARGTSAMTLSRFQAHLHSVLSVNQLNTLANCVSFGKFRYCIYFLL
jgi:hypothetical protein